MIASINQFARPLLLSIMLGVILYAITIFAGDVQSLQPAAVLPGPGTWSVILGLSLVNYGLRFMRWEIYINRLSCHIPRVTHLIYYLAGFAFTTTPGKAGETVRSLYLSRHGVAYSHSFAAFFTERLVDMMAVVLLALFAVLTFEVARWPVIAAGSLALLFLALMLGKTPRRLFKKFIAGLGPGKLRKTGGHLLNTLNASSTLLGPGMLSTGLTMGILAWGAEGVALYIILDHLGAQISPLLAIGIYSASVMAGALTLIPGGLGGTEAVMILLIGSTGADTPTAIAATLICRIATLWFAVALGLLAVGGLEMKGYKLSASDITGANAAPGKKEPPA